MTETTDKLFSNFIRQLSGPEAMEGGTWVLVDIEQSNDEYLIATTPPCDCNAMWRKIGLNVVESLKASHAGECCGRKYVLTYVKPKEGFAWVLDTYKHTGRSMFAPVGDADVSTVEGETTSLYISGSSAEEELRKAIRWMKGQHGAPTRSGPEGAGYLLGRVWESNPFERPAWARSHSKIQWAQYDFGWQGEVFRGRTSASKCVDNAVKEMKAKRGSRAIAWLCAGQAHNASARALFREDSDLTLKVLAEEG